MVKPRKSLIFIFFSLITLIGTPPLFTLQEDVKTQQEYIEVINKEVIIRAFKKGQLTKGLKEFDFSLYENGEKRKITSFEEVHRKIGLSESQDMTTKKSGIRRFFLIYFWISEPLPAFTEALDHFFNHIYQDNDYVLLAVKNQVFSITKREEIPKVSNDFKSKVAEIAIQTKKDKDIFLKNLDELFTDFERNFRDNERAGKSQDQLIRFLQSRYRAVWDEYKTKFVNFDVTKLKTIADSLKRVEFEKWGLVFFQPNVFPKFKPDSIFIVKRSSLKDKIRLDQVFQSFSREMSTPTGFYSSIKEIQKHFIDANATFHLIFLSLKSRQQFESRFLRLDTVYSDWEEVFKTITQATGGKVIHKPNLKESLSQAINKEDIHYRLTFAPQISGDKTSNIEVKAKDHSLKLVYNEIIIITKANEINIKDFNYTFPKLEFTLNNYQQLFDGNQLYGDLEIKVTAIDAEGEMKTFKRVLKPEESKFTASMKINFPHGGKYSLILEAFDNQTGKSAVYSQKIQVPKIIFELDPSEPVLITQSHRKTIKGDKTHQLNDILRKSAIYCKKLKKATFYFTCKENIVDTYFIKERKVKEETHLHDYQIILREDGKMEEQRSNTGKTIATKTNIIKPLIITSFFSNYPFLLPVSLLSEENQDKYSYQLLAREKMDNRNTFKIVITPKQKGSESINHGVAWIDPKDGSVIKIELNPRSIRGIEKMEKKARQKGYRLKITDHHWFGVKRQGIRFPSKTSIHEIYLTKQNPSTKNVEESKTVFNYKDYRFFYVNVDVVQADKKK
jgi:hypothetical protein